MHNCWAAHRTPFPGPSCAVYTAWGLTLRQVGMKPPNSARRFWARTWACGGWEALCHRRGCQTFPLLIWFGSTSWGGVRWRQEGEGEAPEGAWQGEASSVVLPWLHRTFPTPPITPVVLLLGHFCGPLCPPTGVWISHCGLWAPPRIPPAHSGLLAAIPRLGKRCPVPLTETDGGSLNQACCHDSHVPRPRRPLQGGPAHTAHTDAETL